MPNTSIVEPKITAQPAAPVEPTADAAPDQASGLPEELLRTPAMQAVLAGAPPAVSDNLKSKRPEFAQIARHKDSLLSAGLGLYRSLSGDTGVLFNQLYINGNDLLAADKAGQLLAVAPPVDQVAAEIAKSGMNNPIFTRESVPTGAAAPASSEPPQSASGLLAGGATPQNSELQSKVLGARLKNAAPGAPTSGPAPGRGRLLNKILSPVI